MGLVVTGNFRKSRVKSWVKPSKSLGFAEGSIWIAIQPIAQIRRTTLLSAWVVTLLISYLPDIFWREIIRQSGT